MWGGCRRSYLFCFFFFQAEDGIRDDLVTGVQTCALPISPMSRVSSVLMPPGSRRTRVPQIWLRAEVRDASSGRATRTNGALIKATASSRRMRSRPTSRGCSSAVNDRLARTGTDIASLARYIASLYSDVESPGHQQDGPRADRHIPLNTTRMLDTFL